MKINHLILLCTSLALMSFQSNNEFVDVESNNTDSNGLVSEAKAPVTDVVEYPLYHVVYDPTTEMLDISLDPQYEDYDPGVYTHITFFLDVNIHGGGSRRYSGAFPIKGHCWANMSMAYVGQYTMHLYIDGIEFNTTTFYLPTAFDGRIRNGSIMFQYNQAYQ